MHIVINHHSRVAYVKADDDETAETATEVLNNAVAWFAKRGTVVHAGNPVAAGPSLGHACAHADLDQ